MIELPLFPGYRPDLDWSKARVDEARDFIKMVLTTKVKPDERFLVGYSGGKDSTLLLQLMLEVCDELGADYKKRLLVSCTFTRYELDVQKAHLERQIERIEKLGIEVRRGYTRWHESYGVVTLGFGVISKQFVRRECNRMKAIPALEASKSAPWNFSGTRGEESQKRNKEERISNYFGSIKTARPLKFIKFGDVWGYLNFIKETKWGLTFKELSSHYENSGSNRDGCWVCPYNKGAVTGLSPAQARVLERLNLIRGVSINQNDVTRSADYPGRQVGWPTGVNYDWSFLFMLTKVAGSGCQRPVNICKQAYDIVKKIEVEENEVGRIIFPEEHILIKDLHEFRERYNILRPREWMLNEEYWCGRKLINLSPLSKECFTGKPPAYVMNRSNGDWFGRWAREEERIPLWRTFEKENNIPDTRFCTPGNEYLITKEVRENVRNSGYLQDEKVEPVPGFYRDGDPAADQEKCKLEVVARTWMNE